MRGRNILEGVVVLHEMLHEIHSKKLDGVIFKVDFENAYDKVKWTFLQQALHMKGLHEIWRKHVASFVQKGVLELKSMMILAIISKLSRASGRETPAPPALQFRR